VEWLRLQPGIVIDADVMLAAAESGQTAMCEHLHSTGCCLSAELCSSAADWGHVHILRWLRVHSCLWDVSDVLTKAACNSYIDVLDFVIEQGDARALDAELMTELLNCAGADRKLPVAQWFRQHGAAWPAVL
jgi:hypothetical protein